MTSKLEDWGFTYAALVFAAAAALAWSMRSALSPFLLFLVFLLLVSPYAGTQRHRLAVLAASLVFGVWLLDTLGSLLAPFVLAIGIAYLLDPAADRLERRMPRTAAVAVLAVPVLAVVAAGLVFGVPALVRQVAELAGELPAALERLGASFDRMRARLGRLDLPILDRVMSAASIETLGDRIVEYVEGESQRILTGAWATLLGVGRGVRAVFTVLGYVVLTPVLTIYLLRDFDRVTGAALDLIPQQRRPYWSEFFREYNALLSRFLRGQLVAAAIVGVLTWLGLLIVGFPYSGLVGAVAGVFNIVPYLGLVVSIVPVLVIALASGSVLSLLLKAGIVFAIVQAIDGSVTGPRIVGTSIGLHPVWVILALAVGSFFFGFVGLLLAMPGAVLVKLLLRDGLKRYRASGVYEGRGAPDGE